MQRRVAPSRALEWGDLKVFLALARTSSLVAGGRALGMDKSTASRHVAALERALGTRLFVRTREGLRISAAGERLRGRAERVEAEIRALESAAIAAGEEVSGLVRIATTEAMATRLVEEGLLDLRATYPALELEVVGGNKAVDVGRGEADLAVRVTPTSEAGLKVRVVAKLGLSLFASAGYVRTRGAPRTPAQLAGHHVLVQSGELAHLPEARWLGSRPGVEIALRCSSMPAIVAAATRDHGICAITTAWGTAAGLVELFALEQIAARPVWLVAHPDVLQRTAVRVVADRIAEGFGKFARR